MDKYKEAEIDKEVLKIELMIRIALVGEIASGKTFVAKTIRLPTFNADLEVKKNL